MKRILILFALCIPALGWGQTVTGTEPAEEPVMHPELGENWDVYTRAEYAPTFPGGAMALQAWFTAHTTYPTPQQRADSLQGTVVVACVLEPSGKASQIQTRIGLEPALDQEAERLVAEMPRWNPALHHGDTVRVQLEVPVKFRLPKED